MTEKTPAELEAEKQAKADADKAEAETKDAEFEASIANLSDEEKEAKRAERQKASSSDKKIDYEAELLKEKERADKAEQALADKRFKDAEAKRKREAEGIDEETEEKAVSRIQTETQNSLKLIQRTQANDIAGRLSSSEAERQLIIAKWGNRIFPADMPLDEQIEEVFILVNGKKLVAERNEALRGLRGKEGVSSDASATHHDEPKSKEPQVAPDVKSVLAQQGFAFNQSTKRYEKKLANGKVLYKDLKTGKIHQEGVPQAPIGS